jgi:hypothetical protein
MIAQAIAIPPIISFFIISISLAPCLQAHAVDGFDIIRLDDGEAVKLPACEAARLHCSSFLLFT